MDHSKLIEIAEQQRGALDQRRDPMPLKRILMRRAICLTARGKAYWNGRLNVAIYEAVGSDDG